MQSPDVQHPGRPRWSIGRMMGFVVAVSLTIGAARPWLVGIDVGEIQETFDQFLSSLLLAILAGCCWDVWRGGRGLLGSVVGGWIASGIPCFWLGGMKAVVVGVAYATVPALCIGLLLSVIWSAIQLGLRQARPRQHLVADSSNVLPARPGPTDAPR